MGEIRKRGMEPAFQWGAIPGAWLRHGRVLHRSSEVLWQPLAVLMSKADEAEARGIPTRDAQLDFDDWDHSYAYLLLASAALECVVKAAALQAEIVKTGKIFNGPVAWIATHNLPKLVARAGIEIDASDSRFLPKFQTYMVWAGRYPAMLDLTDGGVIEKMRLNIELCRSGRAVYLRLFECAVRTHDKHYASAVAAAQAKSNNEPEKIL